MEFNKIQMTVTPTVKENQNTTTVVSAPVKSVEQTVESVNPFDSVEPEATNEPTNAEKETVSKLLSDHAIFEVLFEWKEIIATSVKEGHNWKIKLKSLTKDFCNFISEYQDNGVILTQPQMIQILIHKVTLDTNNNGHFDAKKALEVFAKCEVNFKARPRNKKLKVETILEFED